MSAAEKSVAELKAELARLKADRVVLMFTVAGFLDMTDAPTMEAASTMTRVYLRHNVDLPWNEVEAAVARVRAEWSAIASGVARAVVSELDRVQR